jgi:orotidine-5'-phosphate decarboxylase
MSDLPARERIILAVDTSEEADAERLTRIAWEAGARFVKLGTEISSATSWRYCSELAGSYGLNWIADAKIYDIPATVAKTVKNIAKLEHPPFGITMHTTAGQEAMRKAQAAAGGITMFGVTILTSMDRAEAWDTYGDPPDITVQKFAMNAVTAGIKGIVCSGLEVGDIKFDPDTKSLLSMVPGTRSETADTQDQARTTTPAEAIRQGADLLVIGRQINQAPDPAEAYEVLVAEIEAALQ